ncbi:hypothetical protein SASPL_110116 [Salvia splendens]|uniref:Uncharacterized protein n=1 Tax=Salvia splendens TaxID=180675 RepID=A0A8X9A245_SALSN|nr:hypothetical protein SASPL_110116 [Salvia splendens]
MYGSLKSMNEFILDEVVANCPLNFNMVMIEDNKANDGGDQPVDAAYQSMKYGEDAPNISVEEKSKSATTRQKEKLYVEEEKLQDRCSSEVMLFNSKSYARDEMPMASFDLMRLYDHVETMLERASAASTVFDRIFCSRLASILSSIQKVFKPECFSERPPRTKVRAADRALSAVSAQMVLNCVNQFNSNKIPDIGK